MTALQVPRDYPCERRSIVFGLDVAREHRFDPSILTRDITIAPVKNLVLIKLDAVALAVRLDILCELMNLVVGHHREDVGYGMEFQRARDHKIALLYGFSRFRFCRFD